MDSPNRFRDANERIAARAREVAFPSRVPFLCECTDERCTELVPLALEEYEGARAHTTRVITLPGHPVSAGGAVVDENDRYALVDEGAGVPIDGREL